MRLETRKYKTKQRILIEDFLKERSQKHFTPYEISRMLTDEGNPVGLSTVYRTLELLNSEGLVRKHMTHDSSYCYSYLSDERESDEYHMVCKKCRRLFHAKLKAVEVLKKELEDKEGFTLDPSLTVLYGICSNCVEKNK